MAGTLAKRECLFKVLIIGDASTGKSSILRRYCSNDFSDKYTCTVGVDFQVKILKMSSGQLVKLQIWDTAGQERYRIMATSYYRGAKACLIVYDITRKETFANVRAWAQQYKENNVEGTNLQQPILILGNKKDLQHEREVTLQEGEKLAAEIGVQFAEVSAKDGPEEISQLFFRLAEDLLTKEQARGPRVAAPPFGVELNTRDSIGKKKKKHVCC